MKPNRNTARGWMAYVGALLFMSLGAQLTWGAPAIAVYPASLTFTGQVYSTIAPQFLTVSNAGDAPLNYALTSDRLFLNVHRPPVQIPDIEYPDVYSPTGTLAVGMATTLVVNVSTRGLPAMRTYAGTLEIDDTNATNSPVAVSVSLSLSPVSMPSRVLAWGLNDDGQTNVPVWLTNAVAVAAGSEHSLALLSGGAVVAWGANDGGQTNVPDGVTNAIAVAGGGSHSLALRVDGTVLAWGTNSYGQTNVPVGLTNVRAVAAGLDYSLALRADGTVVAWGDNIFGQTNVPSGLTNVVAVAAGECHSLALLANGTVAAWGDNADGQTNVPIDLTNAVAVAAGAFHSLALCADGTVVAWGLDDVGQTDVPNGLENVVDVSAGLSHSVALLEGGTVVAWGGDAAAVTNVPIGLTNVMALGAGGQHSMALVPAQSIVVSSPMGSPNPPLGTNWVIRNTEQSCDSGAPVTDGGTQLVGNVWVGTGSIPAHGTDSSVTFIITNDSSISWTWTTNYLLQVSTSPGLTVNTLGGWQAKDSNVVITANGQPGYKLIGWSGDTNGCFALGTEVIVPMTSARRIVVAFDLTNFTFVVATEHGTPEPDAGSHDLNFSVVTNLFVSPMDTVGGTQYVNVGWVGTGSIPTTGSSNSISFTPLSDSTITWLWRTNYLLAAMGTNGGTVDTNAGWWAAGSNGTVTAIPDVGHALTGWSGDTNGCTFLGNQIFLPMTGARAVTANFGLLDYDLAIVSLYGSPSPTAGVHRFSFGSTQFCSAPASVTFGLTQALCRGWAGSGSVTSKGFSNTASVVITNDSTLTWLWQAGTNQNLLLASNGGQLMSYTGQVSSANGAAALNDGIKGKTSFWKSPTNPLGAYGFVWQFTNIGPAQLDRAVFYNYGGGDSGYYSKGYRLELSMDGTNYTAVTNAVLSKNEKAKTNSLAGQQARWVRLVITNGYKTKFWELSELEVYGYPGLQPIPTQSIPPAVSITSPSNGTRVVYPASVTINVAASDVDGVVMQVVVFGDGVPVATDETGPYSGVWTAPLPGSRQVWATAWDNEGLVSTSAPVVVTVTQQVANLLLPANGGQLLAYTGQLSTANGASKLTDGNHGSTSFWKSPTNPVGPYGFVWQLTNSGLAQLDRAVIYNNGEGDSGRYSKGYRLDVSSDGTNYVTVTNGVLSANEKARTNSLAGLQACWVRLVVTNGYKTKFWELSEVEVYGLIPIVGGGGGGAVVVNSPDVTRPVARLELKNGQTTLGFDTASEQLYSVDFKASLHDEWVPILTDQPGTNAWQVISLPATNISGFYRIRARPVQ